MSVGTLGFRILSGLQKFDPATRSETNPQPLNSTPETRLPPKPYAPKPRGLGLFPASNSASNPKLLFA